jgi:predicted dehydrogenase
VKTKQSRRSFLKETAFGGALLGLSARSHRAIFGAEPPSERVRVGMIGVGNQGGPKNNMKYFLHNIVALCDLDSTYLAEAGAFLQSQANLTATATDDYRRLLDAKDIDAVVVTVPDQWHALMTIEACQAGKDVYCEKPLTLVVNEGRPMIDAARKHGRVVQTGTMQRSGVEFKLAVDLVQKGIVGKVSAVNVTLPGPNWIARAGKPVPDSAPPEGFDYNRWLGPAPYRPYNKNHVHYLFRFYWDYSGGQQTNFGAHHLDIAQWGLGMDNSGPLEIEATAKFDAEKRFEVPVESDITYRYADGITLLCTQGPDRKTGTTFQGEKGWVHVNRGNLEASDEDILAQPLPADAQRLYVSKDHMDNWFECIKTRKLPICDVEIGHRSATVCHLGSLAMRLGRKLQWDPVKEEFAGDEKANAMRHYAYRKPWELPKTA